MKTRVVIGLVCAALVASACAGARAGAGASGTTAKGDLLLLDVGGSVLGTDAVSGETRFTDSGAIGLPDWSRLYSSEVTSGRTTLHTIDGHTGAPMSDAQIPGSFVPSVVSDDGSRVALVEPSAAAPLGEMPQGRASTQIAVADPTGTAEPKIYRLSGNYEPEAFSSSKKVLFILNYFPALSPKGYQVTRLDLKTGDISPAFGPVKSPAPKMSGTRVMHVLSPDHATLYTMYTNQDPAYSGRWGEGEVAFVHTLSLEIGQAVCIDLPEAFGAGPAGAKTLTLSPDGSRLYAVDAAAGLISVIDTSKRRVVDTKHVSLGSVGDAVASAQAGPDGTVYVGVGAQVVTLDPDSLAIEHRWSVAGVVNGLAIGGGRLYVTVPDRVLTLDLSTGDQVGSIAAPGVRGIWSVTPSA
ncbi:MAG: hypothetical protein ABI828_04485 [Actinomycetota bacterium]